MGGASKAMIMIKPPEGYKPTPTVKYRSRPGDWFTYSPAVRPCVHKEWLVDQGRGYVDPGYRINAKGEYEGRQFDLFTKTFTGPWRSLPKKALPFLDAIMACEPVVVTVSENDKTSPDYGRRKGYVDVWEIANPRVTDEGLCFDFLNRIQWCAE